MKIGAIGAAAAVAVLLGASGRGASAEVIVIGSDFEAYPIGSRLPDDDPQLDIPRCRTLVLHSGQTFLELPGPYTGLLSTYRNANAFCEQLTFDERQNWYDHYFKNICVKEQRCDALCKAVFDKVEDKSEFSFQCK